MHLGNFLGKIQKKSHILCYSVFDITTASFQLIAVMKLFKLFTILAPILVVQSHPNGAPKKACLDMTPGHNHVAQPNPSIHKLMIRKEVYNFELGDKINIELLGPSANNKFKGFLVQARNENGQIVGHFETDDNNVKLMDCDAIEYRLKEICPKNKT